MLEPLDTILKPVYDAARLAKGLNVMTEIINEDDYTEYEIRISGIKTASQFAFDYKTNEGVMTYSVLYDLKEGAVIDQSFKGKLDGPFTELRFGKHQNKIELIGSTKLQDFTQEKASEVIQYLKSDKGFIKKINAISEDTLKEEDSLKKECDEAMYKVYLFFRIYGSGFVDHIYRFFKNFTMREIRSSLNTLVHIGLIDKTETFEYEIKSSPASNCIEKEDIIDVINKEIKNNEQ